jgi:hypothetical protein
MFFVLVLVGGRQLLKFTAPREGEVWCENGESLPIAYALGGQQPFELL